MKTFTLTSMVAGVLLHCGVASADPQSTTDALPPEYTPALFCIASYSLITEEAGAEFGPFSVVTLDLRSRGLGLLDLTLKTVVSQGFSKSVLTSDLEAMLVLIPRMDEDRFLRLANHFNCKGMTEQWAMVRGPSA